ncbi:hypothetical protein MMPV_005725 [Pyropia vietnamensis]
MRAVVTVAAIAATAALTAISAADVAVAVGAAAASTSTTTARRAVAVGGRQATILSLLPSCDSECTQRVAARLAADGCQRVRHLRGLRMMTAECPWVVDGAHGDGAGAVGGLTASTRDRAVGKGDWTTIPGVAAWAPDDGVTAAMPVGEPGWPTPRAAESGTEDSTEAVLMLPTPAPFTFPYLWGRDRINQPSLPLDKRTSTQQCYPRGGAGVHVYVADTGCMSAHAEFRHLAAAGRLEVMPAPGSRYSTGEDGSGHGTHVAGTIAGRGTGVAPGVRLTCIKVLNATGQGTVTDVLSALDVATQWAADHPDNPVLLSASLSGKRPHRGIPGAAVAIDMMASGATTAAAAGVVVVAAAGNDAADACGYTPASDPHVVAVGSVQSNDEVAASSNWGACVDVVAPGVGILSADARSMDGRVALSGTSMAAPHVTGLAALVMGERGSQRRLSTQQVVEALTAPAGIRVGQTPLAWLDPTACERERGGAANALTARYLRG